MPRPVCHSMRHKCRKAPSGATCVPSNVPQVQKGPLRCDLCAAHRPTGAGRPPSPRPVCHPLSHRCRKTPSAATCVPLNAPQVQGKGAGAGKGSRCREREPVRGKRAGAGKGSRCGNGRRRVEKRRAGGLLQGTADDVENLRGNLLLAPLIVLEG